MSRDRYALNGSGKAMTAWAIVVAAGQSHRFGGVAKVLFSLNGRPVITYVLDAIQAAHAIDHILVAGNAATIPALNELANSGTWPKLTHVVSGGERRQDSVAAGLAVVDNRADVVVVHDGARPFAHATLFDACVAAARENGAAIAAIPVVDTLKRVAAGEILSTVDRTNLWAAQTPQAFRTLLLREAFVEAGRRRIENTDEAMLMEAIGQPVRIVEGSVRNMKITNRDDLAMAEVLARLASERP